MTRKYGVLISIVIVAVSFFSSLTGYVFGVRAREEKEMRKEIPAKAVVSEDKETVKNETSVNVKKEIIYSYIVKEYNGNVAVFVKKADDTEIYREYDIAINLLPQTDREMLKEGIEYSSLSEALGLIEDYS